MNAKIHFRNGGFYLTQIDKVHTPETLAQRMCDGGFVICHDIRWGQGRTLIINLQDVDYIVLSEATTDK